MSRLTRALLAVVIAAPLPLLGAGAADGPAPLVRDRHTEFTDPQLQPPEWPDYLPVPLHEREAERWFHIVIENWPGGEIMVRDSDTEQSLVDAGFFAATAFASVGTVMSPVTSVSSMGFTASGWANPGTVCASAVNAIHIKTDHDFAGGRSSIFSILPYEMAEVDPLDYRSYLSHETSLQTDIEAGSEIFGGRWAPLVGSSVYCCSEYDAISTGGGLSGEPVGQGWVPREGDVIVIEVARRRYNPEYIEFENRFGGLILIKELGLEPYPIGQVLKPVVGIGRFLGTQYADVGRIRAAHPGVICISTSPMDVIGGFQIIPRDHAMSQEMRFARYKTQWMVVGPLWALDPSWEGTPPLFSDYIYPAWIPAVDEDGQPNDAVSAMEIYLGRFTVRGRYSDAEDPEQYVLLHEAEYLDHYALKNLTHVRVYFPTM